MLLHKWRTFDQGIDELVRLDVHCSRICLKLWRSLLLMMKPKKR